MRILAIRNDRFGEFLLNIPAFRALKMSFKGARLTLMVDDSVVGLAKTIEFVDEVISFKAKKHNFLELVKISNQLRGKFDCAIVFNPSKSSHILSFLSTIPQRIGYNRKYGFLLTKSLKDEKSIGLKHEVDYNLDLVSLLGAKIEDKSISLAINPDFGREVFKKHNMNEVNRVVVIHPFTSDKVKMWPLDYFQRLAISIVNELKLSVFIVGEKSHRRITSHLFDGLGSNIINLIGETTLVELASLLKISPCLVSCDSGPMHLAAAVNTSTISLFRNDIVGKTAKRWGPWGEGHIVIEKSNLKNVSARQILTNIKSILSVN